MDDRARGNCLHRSICLLLLLMAAVWPSVQRTQTHLRPGQWPVPPAELPVLSSCWVPGKLGCRWGVQVILRQAEKQARSFTQVRDWLVRNISQIHTAPGHYCMYLSRWVTAAATASPHVLINGAKNGLRCCCTIKDCVNHEKHLDILTIPAVVCG